MTLSFSVFGVPAPAGSKQGFVNRHTGRVSLVESSRAVRPWREAVKHAALDARGDVSAPTLRTPISLSVTFYLARPKLHFRSGANAHLLRDAAPVFPAGRPDCSKLIRSTEDALTDAGVYADDAQIVHLEATKMYADHRPAGADIRVEEWISMRVLPRPQLVR